MSAELNKHLKKLKDMDVTISINRHDGQEPEGVLGVMKNAAKEAGIYESEKGPSVSTKTTPRFPSVSVQLTGDDANAFMIIGRVSRALREGGATDDEITEFRDEAMSGDYDNVLATVAAWVGEVH